MLDFVVLRRAGQDHGVAALLELLDQLARVGHRLHLVDQLEVELLLGRADVVALFAVGALVGEGAYQLVPAHPDVAVDQPQRQHDPVAAERPIPRDRVVVVGVDQRPVDVQNRDCHRHAGCSA